MLGGVRAARPLRPRPMTPLRRSTRQLAGLGDQADGPGAARRGPPVLSRTRSKLDPANARARDRARPPRPSARQEGPATSATEECPGSSPLERPGAGRRRGPPGVRHRRPPAAPEVPRRDQLARNPEAALATLRDALTVVQSARTTSPRTPAGGSRTRSATPSGPPSGSRTGSTRRRPSSTGWLRGSQNVAPQRRPGARSSASQDTTNTLMAEFDSLMAEGAFRVLRERRPGRHRRHPRAVLRRPDPNAQKARARQPAGPGPLGRDVRLRLGRASTPSRSSTTGSRNTASMLSLGRRRPLGRAVPRHPRAIEYPEREAWQALSERRIRPLRRRRLPVRPRREDQGDPGQAERADLDELPQRHAAGGREEVHRELDPGRGLGAADRHPDLRGPAGPPGRRQDDGLDGDDQPGGDPAGRRRSG